MKKADRQVHGAPKSENATEKSQHQNHTPLSGRGRHGKPKNLGKTAKRLLLYVTRNYRTRLIAVVSFILVSAITSVVAMTFIQTLIDDFILPLLQAQSTDFSGLLSAVLIAAVICLVSVLGTLLYNRMMVTVTQGTLKKIRDEMFAKMQTLPIKYFDTHPHGDIMSHYTNDTDTLRQALSQSIPMFLSSCITIVAVFSAMLSISFWLSLLVLGCLALMLLVTKKVGGMSAKHFVQQQQILGDVNGYIEEMINGQKVIKVFCHERQTENVFDQKNDKLCESAARANKFANIFMPIMMNIGNLQYVLIAIVGGALALGGIGGLTLGGIAAFLTLSRSFSQPISQIAQQINSVVMALAGAERIFKLMDEQPEKDEGYVTLVCAKEHNGELTESECRTGLWAWKHPHQDGSVTFTKLSGDVRLFGVDFGYTESKLVLRNISLFAEPGHKIAFVGATGAGKTTITNLINRFYDIADGKIRYDGININKIKKSDLRRSLGIVLQDTHLFTGTVMENIRFGRLNATDEEVIDAAKLANAHDFIVRLPDGYNTVISGNGESLSQGQRQLLSIARAAVADPPVMILDEATSSIDSRTEVLVQKGMDRLMSGRTVFVIAHRLSTVQNAEAILVLDNGQIIERGSHETLLAQKGRYYQLYTGALK